MHWRWGSASWLCLQPRHRGTDEYSAAISPTTIQAGTTGGTYTVTITNASTSPDPIRSAEITLPSGFGAPSAASVTTPASGWSAVPAGQVVTLVSTGSDVNPGETLVVDITADTPQTVDSYTWQTAAASTAVFASGDFTNTQDDPAVAVTPGALDHFVTTTSGPYHAGVAFSVTATAYDSFGNKDTDYQGSPAASLTGDLSSSTTGCTSSVPGGIEPCPAVYGNFTDWQDGASTTTATGYKKETGRHVTTTATGQTGTSDPSDAFNIGPGSTRSLRRHDVGYVRSRNGVRCQCHRL